MMKKNLIRLSAAALSVACLMSLAACGGKAGSETESGASSAVSSSASAVESGADSSAADGAVSSAADNAASSAASGAVSSAAAGSMGSVEDFVNSDLIQNELASMKAQMAEQGTDINIVAEGNKLVYIYTYGDMEDSDREAMAEALEGAMESMASTFEGIATQLKEAVNADVSVEVRYVDSEGEEIFSKEYFPGE